MKRALSVIFMVMMGAATPLFAQTDDSESTNLDAEFPVVAEGDNYLRESFESWDVYCVKGQEDSTCEVFQLLENEEGNPVARINIIALPPGGEAVAGVTFVAPLGTLLPAGVAMRIDSARARNHPFGWCEQAGCVSRFGLSANDLEDMKRGTELFLTIVNLGAPEEPIELNVSLNGVTAAWESIPTPEAN